LSFVWQLCFLSPEDKRYALTIRTGTLSRKAAKTRRGENAGNCGQGPQNCEPGPQTCAQKRKEKKNENVQENPTTHRATSDVRIEQAHSLYRKTPPSSAENLGGLGVLAREDRIRTCTDNWRNAHPIFMVSG
jgi:hypothetical protein